MKLRSSRVLKRGRAGVVLGLENIKSPVTKWVSRSSGISNFGKNEAERLLLRSGKKGANEAEIGVCIDNAYEDPEMGSINEGIKEGLNSDDKGLFLGSEVLDPIKDLPASCPEGEIEEESVERAHVEEGNKSSTSETDHGFKEEIKSSLACEHDSQHVESENLADSSKIVNGESSLLNDSKNGDGSIDKVRRKKGRGRPRKKKIKISNLKKKEVESVHCEGGESCIVKRKRGRKRKNMESSKCNGDERAKREKVAVRVSERVLQLKSMLVVSGGGTVVDGGRPEKKIERRGRPRKIQGKSKTNEIPPKPMKKQGKPRKLQSEHTVKQKKETRGRPRKTQVKEMVSQKKRRKDMIIKKLKMRKLKLMGTKNSKNRVKGNDVKKHLKVKKFHNEGKSIIVEGMGKGECIKLVREKLRKMLLKAGWMFERRSRQDRVYQDMVYIEPSGRTHWSITRAYSMLTKKVKEGDADSNEVNAFTQLPDEELNMIFRPVDKELGYKKKKDRIWKDGKRIIKKSTPEKKKKDTKPNRKKGTIVKSRKPRLLARGSEKGNKKRNLLSWMIDSGVISSGWKVKYGKTRRPKRKRVFEGTITSDGIVCSCCNKSMSVSEFVCHSGGKRNQGFDHIYLESGVSFRKCLLDSWKKEEELNTIRFNLIDIEGDDPNDDTCNICGDGGNLICCDGCPSTFHQSCLDIQNFPPGDWNCIHCLCKFCGVVSDIAPDQPPSEMLSCGLCEEKFHQSCLIEEGDVDMDSNTLSFCGQKCHELFEKLQTYIGVKNELEDGYSWTLLQRSDISQDLTIQKIKSKVESNSKLAVAYSVMDECFLPIVDERSGTSIIHNVVYNCGSNFRRLNYTGFFTAVLEKGDELITAASIRLHGSRLAEMPFIGTRHMYRRQGMCRRLLDAIESTLSSIGVEELIIPAIPSLLQTWTKVFGFFPIEESKKQEMKCMSMMVFPGIDMLQKPLQSTDSEEKDKSVSQTTPTDAIDCNEMPVDAVEITQNAIDYEKLETTSSNAVDNYEEKAGIEKDDVDYEQMEEDSCFEDKLTNSNDDSLYDLNIPVKNVNETAGPISPESFPDCTTRPCSTESVTCEPHQSSESELRNENDEVKGCTIRPCSTESVTCEPHQSSESELRNENDEVKGCTIRPCSTESVTCEPHQSSESELRNENDEVKGCTIRPCSTESVTCEPQHQSSESELRSENGEVKGCTIRPCSTEFVTCGPHQSSESELRIENDEVKGCTIRPCSTESVTCGPQHQLSESELRIENDEVKGCTIRPCSTESVTCGPHQSSESELRIENDEVKGCTIRPCSTESVTCGPHQSSESELRIENDEVKGCTIRPCSTESVTCGPQHQSSESELRSEKDEVKGFPLTSKNTFDLNLHPTVVGEDSKSCDTRPLVLL